MTEAGRRTFVVESLRIAAESDYRRLADLLGYRLVPWLDPAGGFTVMSVAAGALLAGMIARPGAAQEASTFRCRAFGSQLDADWQVEAYALVALILSYIEPDPAIAWDRARIDAAFAEWDRLEEELRLLRRR